MHPIPGTITDRMFPRPLNINERVERLERAVVLLAENVSSSPFSVGALVRKLMEDGDR